MARARGPNIRFPPPAIYLAAFFVGLFLYGLSRIPLVGEDFRTYKKRVRRWI